MPRILALAILSFLPSLSHADEQSHIDAARELLQLMHTDEEVEQVYDRIMPFMQSIAADKVTDEGRRQILDRHFARITGAMREELNWAKLEPFMIDTYVSVYTEQELRELSQFYGSPIGQKFTARRPELAEAGMRFAMELLEKFEPRMEAMQEEMREELNTYAANKRSQKHDEE